jgi:hypothetical protein
MKTASSTPVFLSPLMSGASGITGRAPVFDKTYNTERTIHQKVVFPETFINQAFFSGYDPAAAGLRPAF